MLQFRNREHYPYGCEIVPEFPPLSISTYPFEIGGTIFTAAKEIIPNPEDSSPLDFPERICEDFRGRSSISISTLQRELRRFSRKMRENLFPFGIVARALTTGERLGKIFQLLRILGKSPYNSREIGENFSALENTWEEGLQLERDWGKFSSS